MTNDKVDAPLVPALFADRDTAARAVEELLHAGIDQADIGVAVPAREGSRIREESPEDSVQGALRGASIGGRLGAVAGIGLAAVTVGTLGVGGLFLAGAGGLLWGGTIGGLLGVVTRVRRRPDVDRWCELAMDGQSVVVAVRVRDWTREPEIAALLTAAGATSVLDHLELDHSWQELEIEHRSGQAAPTPG
jgi:hypothetical protein